MNAAPSPLVAEVGGGEELVRDVGAVLLLQRDQERQVGVLLDVLDEWLTPHPGTDGALGMAMGHVILKEFYVDRQVPRFVEYVKQYSDMPFLITLKEKNGAYVPDKFLTAADLGDDSEGAAFKTVLIDGDSGRAVVPNGSLGFRYGEAGKGKWNLDLEGIDPALSLYGAGGSQNVEVHLPRFDVGQEDSEGGGVHTRGVPVVPVDTAGGQRLATTVYDLDAGPVRCGTRRPAGNLADRLRNDPEALHAGVAGGDHRRTGRTGRAHRPGVRAERRGLGRPLDHDPRCGHEPLVPLRRDLPHVPGHDHDDRMSGRQRRRLRHHVGQEKARPITGWANLAFALDWQRPARQMIGTAFWYVNTDQWRYDNLGADLLATPLGEGLFEGSSMIDTIAQSARSGWMPSFPSLNRNPIEIVQEAREAGDGTRRLRQAAVAVRRSAVRDRGPGRTGELAARAHRVAGEPARLVEQGQRVLPQAPAGDQQRRARRGDRGSIRMSSPGETTDHRASSTCWSASTSA